VRQDRGREFGPNARVTSMNDMNTMPDNSPVSRRGVLAGGAAAAALAATRPGWAQTEGTGSPAVVLVTGTSSGFGRLMAETFARSKLRVIATMRDVAGRNASAAAELRGIASRERLPIDIVEIDVTKPETVERGVAQALQLARRIDVLVNNAAIAVPGPVELLPIGTFDAVHETNVNGSLRMFRALAPGMRERGQGYLIQVSSALGRFVIPGQGAYCSSKAAVEAAMDAIAAENAAFGIDVTVVQPAGPYPTRIQANGLRYFEEMLASLSENEKPRVAAFAAQLAAVRGKFVADERLNPQEIVEGVLRLVAMRHGTRPRRLAIGPSREAAESINQAHDRVQAMIASR